MAVTTNTRKLAALLGASGAGIGTDGLLQPAGIDADMASQAELDALETETDEMRTNIALVAFKTAANGSLAKYNLQDQIVDEFVTNAGVNTGDSTNEILTSGAYGSTTIIAPTGGTTVTTGVPTGYTVLKFTTNGSLTVTTGGNVSILVVGGGGSGASEYAGGGGAGGVVYDSVYAVTTNTYDAVIGAGGAGQNAANNDGNIGVDSTWTINGGALQFTAKGGGAGGGEGDTLNYQGGPGGSGGGASYSSGVGGATTQAGTSQGASPAPDVSIGYAGGNGVAASSYNMGGGGGAGSVGQNATQSKSGDGGTGYNAGAIFGTAVGDGGWFASGGGGGWTANDQQEEGTASDGGGTDGGEPGGGNSADAAANTGGGSGGGGSATGTSGDGGSGVILVRYAHADFAATYNDLTLQSSDTTAEAAPTKADMVILIEDAGSGVASLDPSSGNIKGWVSRYETGGTKTWTQGTLVDEGDWGTDKRILAFHDLTLTGTSGTQMAYKITTHSQSAVYDTKIHATSIGWK